MKLANEILELYVKNKLAYFSEAGSTSSDSDHWHKTQIDVKGNGKTIETRPTGYEDEHEHEIRNWKVMPAGEDGHTHVVEA